MAGLIAALDTADPVRAERLAREVAPHCALLKLGLEYVMANGPADAQRVSGRPVFLDLKLHDIPNTVGRAVAALLGDGAPRPAMLTLHAAGGAAMLEAARAAVDLAGADTKLLGVTVLTSLDTEALHATGVAGGPRQQVLRLARLALAAGMDGLVCSAQEAAMLRDALGVAPILVVPGVRPAGSPQDDQARAATPREAAQAGADFVVVGRPITGAPDPAAVAAAVAAELA